MASLYGLASVAKLQTVVFAKQDALESVVLYPR